MNLLVKTQTDKLVQICTDKTREALGLHPKDYDLQIRLIGVDAALGKWEQTISTNRAVEIGVLVLITADSQALATEISRLVNPYLLHLPLTDNEDMPTVWTHEAEHGSAVWGWTTV